MNAPSSTAAARPDRSFHLPDWLFAALVILGCLGVGDIVTHVLRLRVPGSVFGMLLLVAILHWRGDALASRLRGTCHGLISQLGLFFVPVGVGLITARDILAVHWLAIVGAMVGSFLIGLVVAAGAAYVAKRFFSRSYE